MREQSLAPNLLRPVSLAIIANKGEEEQVPKTSGRKMNNIGVANVVILKQPMVEEIDSNYESYIYHVTVATQSQKKNLEAKKFQPMTHITKPAGKNSEKPIANQVLQNKDRLRAMQSFFFFPPPSKDDKMGDSITLRGRNSYRMRDALPPSQDKQIRFETQDNGVYDWPQF